MLALTAGSGETMKYRNESRAEEKHRREATAWAALTIRAHGAKLHPTENGAWDVELASGAWSAANDWRELCNIAHEIQNDSRSLR